VTRATPQQRNIAQVFQFPVIYDTMTVAENLAFPLRNRKVPGRPDQKARGRDCRDAGDERPAQPARAGLAADAKQKISLGRGLVRPDVSAVLFDEPLTVIDPHLKWQLRRKLKQIHHELKLTLIYVTHDQVEALTFADQVVVMTRGRAVQVGSRRAVRAAQPHLRGPLHRLAGHEFPAGQVTTGGAAGGGIPRWPCRPGAPCRWWRCKLGIRPEYLVWPPGFSRCPAHDRVTQVQDVGTHVMLTARWEAHHQGAPFGHPDLAVGDRLAAGAGRTHLLLPKRGDCGMSTTTKPVNQKAWFLILPVLLCVAFSAILPLMTVVNYSVQDIISPERRVFVGTEWFAAVMRDEELHGALWRQITFRSGGAGGGDAAGHLLALSMPARAGSPRRCW
jgi:ABC-type sugar transport system ATPase subunit